MLYSWQNFSPNRIMINLGFINIYWYGLFLAIAMAFAIFITIKITKKKGIKEDNILDLSLYLIIGGLIGARLYDVFLELPFYIKYPSHILQIWKGGLAIHGGIIAGLFILYLFCKKRNLKFWQLGAALTPGIALGQAIGRFGNFFNQELFGKPTNLPWKIFISLKNRPTAYSEYNYFHPTFLYESIGLLIIFTLLIFLLKKLKDNKKNNVLIVTTYVLLYSILRFSLEFIKIDKTPEFLGLRWPQIMSIILAVVFLLISYVYIKKDEKDKNKKT